jgi:hypothetical protein
MPGYFAGPATLSALSSTEWGIHLHPGNSNMVFLVATPYPNFPGVTSGPQFTWVEWDNTQFHWWITISNPNQEDISYYLFYYVFD